MIGLLLQILVATATPIYPPNVQFVFPEPGECRAVEGQILNVECHDGRHRFMRILNETPAPTPAPKRMHIHCELRSAGWGSINNAGGNLDCDWEEK